MKYILLAFMALTQSTLHPMSSIKQEIYNAIATTIKTAIAGNKDLNETDPDGETFIVSCIKYDFDDLVHLLLQHGAHPNHTTTPPLSCSTPLMHAAARCNLACMRQLFSYGADPNIQDSSNRTALIDAVTMFEQERFSDKARSVGKHTKEERKEIVHLLLYQNADTALHDALGHTASKIAERYHFNEMAQLITLYPSYRQELFAIAHSPITPDNMRSILNRLRFLGSQIPLTYKDEKGNMLIHYAIERDNPIIALALLRRCPKILNITNVHGFTPLQLAVNKGNGKALAILFKLAGKPLDAYKNYYLELETNLNLCVSMSGTK